MDKSISVGIATCIISAAVGAGIQIAVVMEMITQVNAIYYLIGTCILFFVGLGFLIKGIRSKPKTMLLPSAIRPQSTYKATNPLTHRLLHAIICELVGVGLMVGGAFISIKYTSDTTSSGVGFGGIILGLMIFLIGVAISQDKPK